MKLGKVIVSEVVKMQVSKEEVQSYVNKHRAGNWGVISKKLRRKNDEAMRGRGRVVSIYDSSSGPLLVVTEADKTKTYIFFPEEDE